ncbi:hypothetical protein QR66_17860, partial [Chromobacterium piscinae]
TLAAAMSFSFSARPQADIEAMDAFLARQQGARWFWFAYPGRPAIKVTCEAWSVTHVAGPLWSLTCQFEQCFSP